MWKRIIILSILLAAVFLVFRFCNHKPANPPREKEVPLSVGRLSGAFQQSFHTLLDAYYALKDALVNSDAAGADAASGQLVSAAAELQAQEIAGDTSGTIRETADYFIASIQQASVELAEGADLEEKRKLFEGITESLWSLTRTVRYDGQKIYYMYCPMAFDDKGAYWLSAGSEVRNPYFGDRMLHCGEIADSLDYSHP